MVTMITDVSELWSKQYLMISVPTGVRCSSPESLMLNPQEVQKQIGKVSPGSGRKLLTFGTHTTSSGTLAPNGNSELELF